MSNLRNIGGHALGIVAFYWQKRLHDGCLFQKLLLSEQEYYTQKEGLEF